jgi:hypothetical protein
MAEVLVRFDVVVRFDSLALAIGCRLYQSPANNQNAERRWQRAPAIHWRPGAVRRQVMLAVMIDGKLNAEKAPVELCA